MKKMITRETLTNLYNEFYATSGNNVLIHGQENVSCKSSKRIVCFLDELNRAPLDVRQSAMQLVLERQIHEHHLPTVNGQRTLIVAAVNPADDYQVDELDPALLDRFLHAEIEADPKCWLSWARKNGVNSIVRDFIAEHPNRLHWTPADGGVGATPRSWTKLAKHVDNFDSVPESVIFQIMKGKIGSELASQFYSFFKNYVDNVKASDIVEIVNDNKDTMSDIEDIANLIRDKIKKQEAVQKTEIASNLNDMSNGDYLNLLAYLYALEIELCVAFLKSMRDEDSSGYSKLAELDKELTDKRLFKNIVKSASKK